MSRDKKSTYYDVGGIEVFDVIKAKLTEEQFKGFLLGTIIRYTLRANFKESFERDIEKIKNYSQWLHDACQVDEDLTKILTIEGE